MNSLITVLKIEDALRLKEKGFVFTRKRINKKREVYCFPKTDKLMKVLNTCFDAESFFEDNTLTF